MAVESKLIPTVTEYSVSDTDITIFTYYQENELPDTIFCAISDSVGIQNGTPFIEGELLIKVKNYPTNISYQLDNNGNLIQIISTGDEGNYSIDSNGDLIYTTTA